MAASTSGWTQRKAVLLPPVLETDPLTPSQWRTLMAFADTFIPSVAPKGTTKGKGILRVPDAEYASVLRKLEKQELDGRDTVLAKEYLAEKPSDLPEFKTSIWRFVSQYVPSDARKQLTIIFGLLE